MTKKVKVPTSSPMPVGIRCGVCLYHDEDTGRWSAWVRKQIDHDSYYDIYLDAPTQTSMEVMLRTYRPYGSDRR